MRGIHRWPVNSPHKGPVTRKMFPFDDVIMNKRLPLLPVRLISMPLKSRQMIRAVVIWYIIKSEIFAWVHIVSNYHIVYNIRRTKCQNLNVSRLGLQLSLRNILKPNVDNEDVVGAAPTDDASTTSEWSTILLPTKSAAYIRDLTGIQSISVVSIWINSCSWTSQRTPDPIWSWIGFNKYFG